jgi:hypothetical protein
MEAITALVDEEGCRINTSWSSLQRKNISYYKQERQYKCNVIFRRIHETTVAVEKQYYMCVCVCACVCGCTTAGVCLLTYPLSHAQESYCLRPLWLHHIFRHSVIHGTIFGKKSPNVKCVLIFSTTFIWNISHSQKNSARYCHKSENVFMWRARYFCRILKKLAFSWQVLEKVLKFKCHQNPSCGSRVVPCGLTDGQNEANSSFSQFCERAKKRRELSSPSTICGLYRDLTSALSEYEVNVLSVTRTSHTFQLSVSDYVKWKHKPSNRK